jgi:hypothetical protein
MFDQFTIAMLERMMEHVSAPSASIYMPTHKVTTKVTIDEDTLRLKNLLREAENQMSETGMRSPDVRAILAPANELLEQIEFWQNQSHGLALFLAEDLFEFYRLPVTVDELVVVSDRFHIKPLLRVFENDGRFYLLAISQNDVRLLQGTRHSVEEMALEDSNLPTSITEALWDDDPERQLQFHSRTGMGASPGRRAAIFHGHGDEWDNKDAIARYFRKIDAGLRELLKNDTAPLVLAGVDYLLPIYHEMSTYPSLVEEGAVGNPEELSPEQLHERAWKIMEPYFEHARQVALDEFHQAAGTGQSANTIEEVVPAAYYGRVGALFVPKSYQAWGHFDPETAEVIRADDPSPENEDLLNIATVYTLVRGGSVYSLDPAAMPETAEIAALLRF